MSSGGENRAASAIFQWIGNGDGAPSAVFFPASRRGMHRVELAFLAIAVPLTVFLATGDSLGRLLDRVVAWWLAVPFTFLLLNLLPWVLCAKREKRQWALWLLLCTLWSWFLGRESSGIVAAWAWCWLAFAALNGLAAILQFCFRQKGATGLAIRTALLVVSHGGAIALGLRWGWSWALVSGALIAAFYCWTVLRPGCQWLGPVKRTTGDSSVWVTIDDGPDPRDTPALLDLLDLHQMKAVFFMIGEKVRAHPDLAREVVRRGHRIGNHTLSHPQGSFWIAGPWRTRREIAGCQQVILEITGIEPTVFRAPVGHRNWFTHPVAHALGLEVVAWNRRGFDAVGQDAEKVLGRILPELSAGDIVLLHEATPIAEKVIDGVLAACAPLKTPADAMPKSYFPGPASLRRDLRTGVLNG